MFQIGLTDHLEGPRGRASRDVYRDVLGMTQLADRLGFEYAWFSEHHCHAHEGHAPDPILFAVHAAGLTRQIQLGSAIICLNLHHPLEVAERVAQADELMNGRLAPGFGSGSTPEEFTLFGNQVTDDTVRHDRFDEALRVILNSWNGTGQAFSGKYFSLPAHRCLPQAAADLHARSWLAVNSVDSAAIAGRLNFNMLFSHLRTPDEYHAYRAAYIEAGGTRKIAANRPVYVGKTDAAAYEEAGPALRILWRRFQQEGKIPANLKEPADIDSLAAHPINFIIGGPQTVARKLNDLRQIVPFDVANLEHNWAGLPIERIEDSLKRLAEEVRPLCGDAPPR